jgi:hypothetical protein
VEKVVKADIAKHLAAHSISHAVDDLGAILRRIDMDPERARSKWRIDDRDNGACHF